jgi:hypothetical protein
MKKKLLIINIPANNCSKDEPQGMEKNLHARLIHKGASINNFFVASLRAQTSQK